MAHMTQVLVNFYLLVCLGTKNIPNNSLKTKKKFAAVDHMTLVHLKNPHPTDLVCTGGYFFHNLLECGA